MALSETYTNGAQWMRPSTAQIAIVCSKTLDELYGSSSDFDTSILLCNGSTSQYLNNGAFSNAGFAKTCDGNGTIMDGGTLVPIEYLGACLVYGRGVDYINLTTKTVNSYMPFYSGSWNDVKDYRFILDCCNADLYGGAPTGSWADFDYNARKSSCYHFGGTYFNKSYEYTQTNSGNLLTTTNSNDITGDDKKRVLRTGISPILTNYSPTMSDSNALAICDVNTSIMFAFRINGEIFLVSNPDSVPIYHSRLTQETQYIEIGSVKYYLTIGLTSNTENTSTLPVDNESWGLWVYGGWAGNWWVNDWGNFFKTLDCIHYIYNSTGIRWLDASENPSNAGQFRSRVRLGVMDSNGIVKHNQWLIGETAIQESDNPNKSGSYDNIPDRPTPGPTPGPYEDDPWSGATFAGTSVGGAGAFAKVYYMTSTELANLRSWMNSISVPEGFDPMQQIIGLSQVPVALSGSSPENVVFVNSSAVYDPGVTTRAVDTGVATQQSMGTPISYYLGSVDIVRRMQQRGEPYLDYDCQIELYLPLIGMFSLDTQAVMGRTIYAYAILDPVSGTLAAYAYVTKDGQNLPIAYGSTTIGVDLPISAQQLSISRAALKQANAQLGASLLSGALTMLAAASSSGKASGTGAKTATGSSGLSAAGIREAGSDYMKASQVGNVFGDFMQWGRTIRQLSYGNNTAISGSFGGSTAQWAYPFTPYVKIIRPRYEKPSNYAHSQGVPCVQTKTVGSCTGFIQCIGADVSGITGATDLELQAIQAALSNGIYAGGGQ